MLPVPGSSALRALFFVTVSVLFCRTVAQPDTSQVDSAATTGLSFEAYADVYFAFDLNEPSGFNIPYFVSHSRHNEFNVNLACITARYVAHRVRGVFTPGFST
ncbi:MAG: outer membrane beta-barrel protein, partial [Flavobacteriales bacterium]|nr:outer membrane beta-barrel protein [Flavobacteriales bacterium]